MNGNGVFALIIASLAALIIIASRITFDDDGDN